MDSGIVTCSTCGSEIREKATEETWLELPLPGGEWIAAYRLMPEDGREVVAELRVFPNEPGRPRVGQWSAERLGNSAQVPPGGLGARLLRTVKVADHLVNLPRSMKRPGSAGLAKVLAQQGFTDLGPDSLHGRRGHSDLFYAQVARDYVSLLDEHAPKPIRALMSKLKDAGRPLSEAAVRDLVRRARQRGLLTGTTRGKPGGRLTQRAIALLTEAARQEEARSRSHLKMKMRNPADGSIGETTEQAFQKVWKAKGWTRVEDTPTEEEQP